MKFAFVAVFFLSLLFSSADLLAQPQAKEIAFTRPCASGVRLYNKNTGVVSCGAMHIGGAGHVIEMATASGGVASCPKGYAYIGHMEKNAYGIALANPALQFFACAKN